MDIDKQIKEKFTASFMNDSKWYKLIESLTDVFNEIYLCYKLIHSDEIKSTSFQSPDFKPFFIEPILYKEVEWIEFPSSYCLTQNKRTTRQFDKEYKQDIDSIEKIIHSLGEFMVKKNDNGLRLYAFR